MEEHEHIISQFDDDSSSHFLTKVDYHYAIVLDHYEENDYQQEMSMPEIFQEIQ